MESLPENALDGLPLEAPTPDGWAQVARANIEHTLADHAHCELKAASTALRMLGRYGKDAALAHDLCDLAREEMRHFERVHELVLARGLSLSPPGPDRYVKELRARSQRGLSPGKVLLDQLVVCAFVEARSCERFRILARKLDDPALAAFYAELATAESRHHELFLSHAARIEGEESARERTRAVAAIEAELVRALPVAPRIH